MWRFTDVAEESLKRSLSVFSSWQPPAGADFSKGFYGFADGTGGRDRRGRQCGHARTDDRSLGAVADIRGNADRADRRVVADRSRGGRLPRLHLAITPLGPRAPGCGALAVRRETTAAACAT